MTKQITRAVQPEDLLDLLEHPPRANVAFELRGVAQAAPAELRYSDGRYLLRIPAEGPRVDGRVALLVDVGRYHSELRGVRVQGHVVSAEDDGWLELIPDKAIAWDYGAMRRRSSEK